MEYDIMSGMRKKRINAIGATTGGRVVLVGTYRGDQLTKWSGWYNWPVPGNGEWGTGNVCGLAAENAKDAKREGRAPLLGHPLRGQPTAGGYSAHPQGRDALVASDFSKINELWLFKGTKDERRYKAEFVGIKTREELIRDYGYPAKGKAHGDKYLLFRTDFKYRHKCDVPEDAERVIIRTADFATAPKVRKQLKAYLESPDRKDPDLAKRLPEILTRLRPEQLRVCEAAVQMNLFAWNDLQPVHMPRRNGFTAVELFAGAGGLSIGLERAGIHVVIANEIMPDFAATLAANHPETNVINDDRFLEAA